MCNKGSHCVFCVRVRIYVLQNYTIYTHLHSMIQNWIALQTLFQRLYVCTIFYSDPFHNMQTRMVGSILCYTYKANVKIVRSVWLLFRVDSDKSGVFDLRRRLLWLRLLSEQCSQMPCIYICIYIIHWSGAKI